MEKIGRLGTLGLAIESSPGTPAGAPLVFIPFTENSFRVHHEPIDDIAARGNRVANYSSVQGKQWGEGDITMYLDSLTVPYIFKLAFGAETVAQKNSNPPVYDHLMTPTVSGNNALTATLWDNKGVDCQQFSNAAIDTAEFEISTDGIATVKATFMSKAPTTVAQPAYTTTSGTLLTWKDSTMQFGATVATALISTAIKFTNFKLTYTNALSLNYKSGSTSPDTITTGPLKVSGEYTIFFENITDRDAYKALTKRTLIVMMVGANIGAGYTEQHQIVLKKVVLKDIDYETGLEDIFAIKCNFDAEWDQDQAGYVEITTRNQKVTAYA